MTAKDLNSDWLTSVIAFMCDVLPYRAHDGIQSWQDNAILDWSLGCMDLEIWGHAGKLPWNAQKNSISIRELALRLPSVTRYVSPRYAGRFVIRQSDLPPPEPPTPNIAAAFDFKSAFVYLHPLNVLLRLGLVADWIRTKAAKVMLWCEQPTTWEPAGDHTDPRFQTGRAKCTKTMPQDVVKTCHDLFDIATNRVDTAVAHQEKANVDTIARYPAQSRFERTVPQDGQLHSMIVRTRWVRGPLFFAGWRLADGWFSGHIKSRMLPLFHDPLARQMRKVAMGKIGLAFPSEGPT